MAEAKRELLDVRVFEVSLVDLPANEESFAVIKQLAQEDTEMSKSEETKAEQEVVEETTEVQKEEAQEEITSEEQPVEESKEEEAQEVVAEKSEEEVVEEAVEESASEEDQLVQKITAATSEAITKSMGEFATLLKSFMNQEKQEPEVVEEAAEVTEEVEKAEEVTEEEPKAEEVVEKSLEAKFEQLIEALTTKVPVEKSAEESKEEVDLAKSLADLTDKLTGIDSRLAEVESAGMPSKSVEPGADTDIEKSKDEGGFWSSVL